MDPLVLRRTLQVLAGTLAGLAVVAVYVFGPPLGPRAGGAPEVDPAVPEPYDAPPFALVTTEGEPFDETDLRGRVSVVFFGFANCPDVCPLTLSTWSRALERLEAEGRSFHGVFVSVDPARDTPEALREYMDAFHPSLTALTGTSEQITETAAAWGIHVAYLEPDERGADAADAGSGRAAAQGGVDASDRGGVDASERGGVDAAGAGRAGVAEGRGHEGHGASAGPAADPDSGAYGVVHSTRSWVVDAEGRVVRSLAAHLSADEVVRALEPYLR